MKKWTYQDNRLVNKINWKKNKKQLRKEKQNIDQYCQQKLLERYQLLDQLLVLDQLLEVDDDYEADVDDIVDCGN